MKPREFIEHLLFANSETLNQDKADILDFLRFVALLLLFVATILYIRGAA